MMAVGQQLTRQHPPTIYDIARLAGVSHTTVSRAVNGQDGMTEATRRRVLEIAGRMGYERNASARTLAGRVRPQLVALVAAEGWRESGLLVDAVARQAHRAGLALTIVDVDPADERSRASAAARIGEPGTAGIVLIAADPLSRERLRSLAETTHAEVPKAGRNRMLALAADSPARVAVAVEHLAGLGHRRIALAGADTARPVDHACGVPGVRGVRLRSIAGAGVDADAGFRLGQNAGAFADCTALLAPTVSFALGAVRGLRLRGVRVPWDLSIVSLEDHADARHAAVPLTTVSSRRDDLAATVVARLLAAHDELASEVQVRARLVARQSTAPVHDGARGERSMISGV
ncbi:LacI family transcriptional regulator [Microbacterium sp. CFH 31415]|uniref:LacI family DNA-binding transcriptional regulator n=1 Tax=Microbacterium sp. CFH 31415 TaxID=2921732 RepID=UPI001F13E64B|nr:LacI family DNA-binding transcriptional regulator [Microbacterium sp. CFH 31415]MCH6231468.1 LacI family transcriptional regulator [Microbacterium sp. CFH 31415]